MKGSSAGLCACLGILCASPAVAGAAGSEELVAQGDELLLLGHLELAVAAYEQAYERDPSPAVALKLGRAYELSGQAPEALRLYARLADLPGPEGEAAREAVRRLRPQMGAGQLALSVHPDGAEVLIDGESRGAAPLQVLELGPGRHQVRAVLAGYRPAHQIVEILPGRVTSLFLALDLLPSVPPADPLAPWPWVMLASGGALLVAGTVTYAVAEARAEPRESPKKLAGAVLWAGSGAALCASAALFIAWEHRDSIAVTAGAGPQGAMLGLAGRF